MIAGCWAVGCREQATHQFRVGPRPFGVTDMTGWPAGAPDIGLRSLIEGDTVHLCPAHAHDLRQAAVIEQWIITP